MIHACEDYNRIQDPAVSDPSLLGDGSTPIGEDKPVFLLRARDAFAPTLVRLWAASALQHGMAREAEVAQAWAVRIEEWQAIHGCKVPDLPIPV